MSEDRKAIRTRRTPQQWSDAEIVAALTAAYNLARAEGRPGLSKDYYDVCVHDGRVTGPSWIRIVQRFKTWKAACDFADIPTGGPGRASYVSKWSDDRLIEVLREYLDEPGSTGSYQGFDAWVRERTGYPSAQTVRNRIGPSWAEAKATALGLSA